MIDHLVIEPMSEDFVLWRCLHSGPLSPDNIDYPEPNPQVDFSVTRRRNIPLLEKLIKTYGSCAIIGRENEKVVATLRFYPKALCSFSDAGIGFCLQQDFPAGPSQDLAERELPSMEKLPERILFAHCMMIVSPKEEPDRYRRQGLATRMAQEMIRWARERGWHAIEAVAYEEIPFLYAISGSAGKKFWERLEFKVTFQDTEPGLKGELLKKVREQAAAAGIPKEHAANRYKMCLDLE